MFIASSSDCKELRAACEKVLQQAVGHIAPETGIEPYSYDTDEGWDVADQRISMQENIPRPGDPNCVGVVCFLGERIGYPLGIDRFPLLELPNAEAWTRPDLPYRLLHPWPRERDEVDKALDDGCFPLTGTVFEFLDAHGRGKPVHLCLYSDREISTADTDEARLGGRVLKKEKVEALSEQQWTVYYQNEYLPQTRAVRNFMRAVADRDHSLPQVASLDMSRLVESVRRWLAKHVLHVTAGEANPFRFLDYFDIDDGEVFFGRTAPTKRAVEELIDRLDGQKPASVCLLGPSGSGKSSLLRGGVLHELKKRRDTYEVMAVRPTDFEIDADRPVDVINQLLARIDAQTKIDIGAAVARKRIPLGSIPQVVKTLEEALPRPGTKLVIGFDQFEEIIDELAGPNQKRARAWAPLLDFVDQATSSGFIGVVFTLESTREKLFKTFVKREALKRAKVVRLDGVGEEFLNAIFVTPFAKAGFRLAEEILTELHENVRKLQDATSSRAGSPLPLIALKLSLLFDHVRDTFGHRRSAVGGEGLGSAFGSNSSGLVEIKRHELTESLDFEQEIGRLAESAWREGFSGDAHEEKEELDHFLRPLIRLGEGGHVILSSTGERPFRLEQALDRSFRRHRLLVFADGRWRLVHEAVLREWPKASAWLKNARELFAIEREFGRVAAIWDARGRQQAYLEVSEERIDQTVRILNQYIRFWALPLREPMEAERALLRDYCLAVFGLSKTPRRLAPDSVSGKAHVHVAAEYGQVELLAKFAELDEECLVLPDKATVPIVRAGWGQVEAVAFLLGKGVDGASKAEEWPAIATAIQMGRTDIFRLFLPHYRNADALTGPGSNNMLHVCAQFNRVDFAREIIRLGLLDPSQPNVGGMSPLHFAAYCGHSEAYGFFRDCSLVTALTTDGESLLELAASQGHVAIVEALLEDWEFVTSVGVEGRQGKTPLMLAAENRHARVVEALVPVTKDPNVAFPGSDSALHRAIRGPAHLLEEYRASREAAFKTVRALLRHDALDPNRRAADGKSPFERAVQHVRIRKALVEHRRFDVSSPLGDGRTPLMFAAEARDRSVVARILEDPRSLATLNAVSNKRSAPQLLVQAKMGDLVLPLVASGRVDPWLPGVEPPLLAVAIDARDSELTEAILGMVSELSDERRQVVLGPSLMSALRSREPVLVERLISAGAGLDAVDEAADAGPLHLAAKIGNQALLKQLLVCRGGLDRVDSWGRFAEDQAPDLLRAGLAQALVAAGGHRGGDHTLPLSPPNTAQPFYSDQVAWRPTDRRAFITDTIKIVDGRYSLGETTEMSELVLPFYEHHQLLRLKDPTWEPRTLRVYCLISNDGIFRLDDASAPIHDANEKEHLALKDEWVMAYLTFFCFFVRGDEGAFLLVDRLDNPFVPPGAVDLERSGTTLRQQFRAPRRWGRDPEGRWQVSCLIYYGTDLAAADMVVSPDGLVRMTDDEPLIGDLPTLDAPIVAPLPVVSDW